MYCTLNTIVIRTVPKVVGEIHRVHVTRFTYMYI